ncbi:hypothetical protein FA95DRAFT_1684520 [Auriscalpium vulgare]|uniref:Uncharacterized protein n=1 Tax=Auriscalpium vulgare TaxID=40419 RepID=A0ACB8R4U1_9AGAM|nr:hypothetical protein FA95DRAFT_1684520 [Auriscalpium vulgare]
MSSPFFQNLFTLPQPPTSSPHTSLDDFKDGIPVLCLSEDEHAVDMMLRYCYPRTEPTLDTAEDVKLTLALLSKYQLAGVEAVVVQRLKIGPTIPRALSIFLKAWLLDLRKVVPVAARHTLRAQADTSEDYEELLEAPCIVWVKLENYRKACADAASACPLKDTRTGILSSFVHSLPASCPNQTSSSVLNRVAYVCPAIKQYLINASTELKLLPSGSVLQEQLLTAVGNVSKKCKKCLDSDCISAVIELSRLLSEEVERRISEVETGVSFF